MLPSTLHNTRSSALGRHLRRCARRVRQWPQWRPGTSAVPAALALGLTLALSFPTGVDAGPGERRKISKTLADRLEARSNDLIQIIVDGDAEQVERLARRYNLKVTRHLRRGSVLEVTGGQLDALARDADVTHLSADSLVHPPWRSPIVRLAPTRPGQARSESTA